MADLSNQQSADNFMTFKFRKGQVVRFNAKIDNHESGFDAGMMAEVAEVSPKPDDVTEVIFDFSKFEVSNQLLEQPNFYGLDGSSMVPWSRSSCYPANKKESLYFDSKMEEKDAPFEVIGALTLVQELNFVLEYAKAAGFDQAAKYLGRSIELNEKMVAE